MENKEIKEEKVEEELIDISPMDELEQSTNSFINQLNQNALKSNKMIGISAGVVAAINIVPLSLAILTNDPSQIVSSTGTIISMSAYAAGSLLLVKNYQNELTKEPFSITKEKLIALKEQLSKYQSRLERYKIQKYMHLIAGTGFATTFMSHLLSERMQSDNSLPIVLSTALAGLVGVGSFAVAKKQHSFVKEVQIDCDMTAKQIEELETQPKEPTKTL